MATDQFCQIDKHFAKVTDPRTIKVRRKVTVSGTVSADSKDVNNRFQTNLSREST